MKTIKLTLFTVWLAMAGFLVHGAPLGTAFIYQGQLKEGAAPAQGFYELRFAVFDAPENGVQLGLTLTNAPTPVASGLFIVTLDFGPGVFDGNARWLEIGVRTNGSLADFTVLTPRQPISPTPYALSAASVPKGAITSGMLSTGSVTAVHIMPGAVSQLGTPNGTNTAAMQVSNTGLLGVGTPDPQAGLHISTGRELLTPELQSELVDGQGSWSNLAGNCFVAVSSNLVAIASYTDDSVTLVSISNPAAPVSLSSTRDGSGVFTNLNGANGVALAGSLLAVSAVMEDAVTLMDISNPAAPVRRSVLRDGLGGFNDLNGPSAVLLTSNLLAVAATDDDAVSLIDVENSSAPVLVGLMKDGFNGFNDLNGANALALYHRTVLAIAALTDNAVTIADIHDPSSPELLYTLRQGIGPFSLLSQPVGLACSGNLLAIAAYGSGAVILVDLRDPTRPVHLATIQDTQNSLAGCRGLAFQGNILWVAGENDSTLTAIDVTVPSAPVVKTVLRNGQLSFNHLGQVRSLASSGDILFAGANSAVTLLNGTSTHQAGLVSEGWVGIGVSQPAVPLHVMGNVLVEGGSVTANSFAGDGALVTNVNAARLKGLDATSSNLPNTVVIRDATGSFSASNVYVANLSLLDTVPNGDMVGVVVKLTNNFLSVGDASAIAAFLGNACGSNNAGPSCSVTENVGQIGWGGATSRSGALPSGGSGEHWYRVSFGNSGTSYHPHVYLSSGAAYYTFDVYLNCAGSSLVIESTNWETLSSVVLPYGTQIYVRVRPYTANYNCQTYMIVFVNG